MLSYKVRTRGTGLRGPARRSGSEMTSAAEWLAKDTHNFTPKTKLALKLYVSGAARTQEEAAAIVGCHKQSVSNMRRTKTGREFEDGFDSGVTERMMSLSAVIDRLSKKAVVVMEDLIDNGSTEDVRFKAAKDILDRNPETSKTNKVQVESFTLSGRDAKELALAMTEGRLAVAKFEEATEGDFVRVQEVTERPNILEAGTDEQLSPGIAGDLDWADKRPVDDKTDGLHR